MNAPGIRENVRRAVVLAALAVWAVLVVWTIVATGETWTLYAWGAFTLVGGFLLLMRRGNAIGRIMLGLGLYWAVFGALTIPGSGAWVPAVIASFVSAAAFAVWLALPLLLVVFPSGRVETILGRVVAVAALAVSALVIALGMTTPALVAATGQPNPLHVPALEPIGDVVLSDNTFLAVPVVLAAAVADLVVRWIRSRGATRLQYAWLVFGAAVTAVLLVVSTIVPAGGSWLFDVVAITGFSAIPAAIWIAVTRHGLFEIGRVVSRTVAYTIVTGAAVAVYAAIVITVSGLLPDLPAIGVALATLAAAGVFLPALRMVQGFVDQRFDREHYDAEKVVDAFGERLRAGVDPADTGPDLIATVERALGPVSVGLWTKGSRA